MFVQGLITPGVWPLCETPGNLSTRRSLTEVSDLYWPVRDFKLYCSNLVCICFSHFHEEYFMDKKNNRFNWIPRHFGIKRNSIQYVKSWKEHPPLNKGGNNPKHNLSVNQSLPQEVPNSLKHELKGLVETFGVADPKLCWFCAATVVLPYVLKRAQMSPSWVEKFCNFWPEGSAASQLTIMYLDITDWVIWRTGTAAVCILLSIIAKTCMSSQ